MFTICRYTRFRTIFVADRLCAHITRVLSQHKLEQFHSGQKVEQKDFGMYFAKYEQMKQKEEVGNSLCPHFHLNC